MSASAESLTGQGASASSQSFVINLAASTSPMALSHPSSPALKRFTFFVSRQREEGRERFRLHMGYFATQEEAEALLPSVRDIYPGAWAGPAPTTGAGRRGRIAPGSVVAAAPVAAAPVVAPTVPVVAPAAPARPAHAAPPQAAPRVAAPAAAARPAQPQGPAAPPVARAATAPQAAVPAAAAPPAFEGLDTMSNVRDVLAQLSESPAPAARQPAPAVPTRPAAPAAARATAAAPAAKSMDVLELSNADALSLLESPVARPAPAVTAAAAAKAAPVGAKPPPAAAKAPPAAVKIPPPPPLPPLRNPFEGLESEPEVRLVTPEDTQTLTDIRVDRENNAPPCFAVQLAWSVNPIDVSTLPHLAIFEAYTLYNVEGNRQGRRWYGLRLGFFSDPNSATQVANYVRSDYKNVAVVPVAVKERDRARGVNSAPATAERQKTSDGDFQREGMQGFELLADDRPPPPRRDLDDMRKVPAGGPAARAPAPAAAQRVAPKVPAAAPAAGKPTGKPAGKRVVARRRPPTAAPDRTVSAGVGGPEVLESTLEILGASTLSLDEGRKPISDAAARRPDAAKSGGGRFSRLLSKLGGN